VNSELIVDVSAKEISMALLEDQRLVELQRERRDLAFAVGDIYLGRVKKVMPGLNAAFVDVGYKKDAFLHYLDLGMIYQAQQRFLEQIEKTKAVPALSKIPTFPDLPKDGKIADYLKAGQNVLVQVVKEPISTKGPRLSAEISIAGRNLVLVPFSDKVSVSAKIESHEERARLKQLILSMKPKNFSVIIRTSAEGKRASELDQELSRLLRRWEESIQKLPKITKTPKIVYEESSRALGILRDTFNPSFQSIHVNDKAYYEEIREYVRQIAPGREDIVHLYTGNLPIFDEKNVTKQIKASFGRTVTCKSGAYLIIEQTEAMYGAALEFAALSGNETVWDLYCGIGTISLFLARQAKKVYGVEIVPAAIRDAKENAKRMGYTNTHYEAGTAEEIIPRWYKEGYRADALIVDPPRTGLDDKLLDTIVKYAPEKMVYVSCNVSTLARDLVRLVEVYDLHYIQSVDMFPHTARTEAVVKLTRRKPAFK